jgi:hypothetical protein
VPTDWPAGRQFIAVSILEGGERRRLLPGTELAIWFREPGTLEAYAGCHRLSVSALIEDERLSPQRFLVELRSCATGSLAQDAWVRAFFESRPLWSREGDLVILRTDDVTIRLSALP